MKKLFTLLIIVAFTVNINAQKNDKSVKATNIGEIPSAIIVPSIAEQIKNGTFIPAPKSPKNGRMKMKGANHNIIGKGLPKGNDPLIENQKNAPKVSTKSLELTFIADASSGIPSDPTGAVGPNHYIGAWNTSFRIFDKLGNPLTPEASLATIFPGNAIGDPIVLYDAIADRFVITEFDNNPNGFNVAISQGPDPVNDGWYIYTTGFGTGSFPDYTKFSIWPDGYYVTANIGTNRVFVVEREEMLQGNAAQFLSFPLPGLRRSTIGTSFYSPQIINVCNEQAPANGNATVIYMQDDAWANVSQDHLKLWSINVDWVNTANSTISTAQQITTSAFTSFFPGFNNGGGVDPFSNLEQPFGGIRIDALAQTMSNQAQFRKFASHNSVVCNFPVDVAAGSAIRAGIRWFELRQDNDGSPWTLFQEGTYTAPDNKHAWAGSMAMDSHGNIGMGYTSMGGDNEQRIAINYTGRFDDSPIGTMPIQEELIAQSSANNTNSRYADYTHLTVDAVEDTFWFISEYFDPNRRDVVGVFKIEPTSNDTGVTSIDAPINGATSATEQVTITINNFGDTAQSNIPVSYTFNGNTVNEIFTGSIEPGASAQYTFTETVNMSTGEVYHIEACANLTGDESVNNDCTNIILNQLTVCIPVAGDGDTSTDTGCNLDGIKHFILGAINIDDGGNGCNNEGGGIIKGYADRRNLSTDLNLQIGTYILQSQMNWDEGINGPEKLSVWIDFNDNGAFEGSEQLIFGEEYPVFNELTPFDLVLPSGANLGSHTLRVRSLDTTGNPGDVNDPCADYAFGETQDYTVNIIDQVISVDENLFNESDFIVATLPNNQFNISVVNTTINERLAFSVSNTLGQILVNNYINNTNGGYSYDLDMSYATPGVYIIRLGNSKLGNTKKIIIK